MTEYGEGTLKKSSGASYCRARYYDPAGGRFPSEDPIGFHGGDVNLYRYVWGSTPDFRDPIGLWGYGADFNAGFFGGWGSGFGGSISAGKIGFRDSSNSCSTQGSYTTGTAFVAGVPDRIAPFGNSQGDNPTHGFNFGFSGGVALTNANYAEELSGRFENTTYAIGPLTIDVAKGDTVITMVTITGGVGIGLGVSHHKSYTIASQTWEKCDCPSSSKAK